MNADRRGETREPHFSQAALIAKEGVEGQPELPVLLRDVGRSGVGAVYIGQEPPPREGNFDLRTETGPGRNVRLMWTMQAADYVYLLGLELADEQEG